MAVDIHGVKEIQQINPLKLRIMKTLAVIVLAMASLCFTNTTNPLTDAEREAAIKEMTSTRDRLLNTMANLSEEQLTYKASEDSWSIADCTEHIAVSENMIFDMLLATLEIQPDTAKRSEVNHSDEQILAMISDRSNKVKTSKAFEPTGKYGSHEAALENFKTKRDQHIEFIKNTQEDLRNRYQQVPFGTLDAYQILLFIAAHTERHVQQIEEIIADPGFPTE